MLKVMVLPADKAGCGFYRMRAPARAVQQLELAEVTVADKVPDRFQADVVVVQRPTRPAVLPFIEACRAIGMAVVVELDDVLHDLPAGHPFLRSTDHVPQVAVDACELADLVTVTTPALAERYAPHGRVRVLPNMLPADRVAAGRAMRLARPHAGTATVGYVGPYSFHVWDFGVVGNGLAKAQTDAGFAAHVVSDDGACVLRGLRLKGTHTGWRRIDDLGPTGYTAAFADLDVGLVPLALNTFNHAKSDLKGLEYAAVGVPFVASPTGPYVAAGSPYAIASDHRDWRWHVTDLASCPSTRAGEAERLLDYAAGRTYEGNAQLWLSAWSDAVDIHRSAASVAA